MLRTDFIDSLNQGRMWAFVGSGPSIAAGTPTWGGLVDAVLVAAATAEADALRADKRFQSAYSERRFEKCFEHCEDRFGRDFVRDKVYAAVDLVRDPGSLHRLLADWPFGGYVTTNYDKHIETALAEIGGGWTAIGNSAVEVRKISGDVTNVVWHVHGMSGGNPDAFSFIATQPDYDALYLEGSPLERQLRALLAMRRVAFIGFGFEDPDIVRLLRRVGQLCSPARPAFAFAADVSEAQKKEWFSKYNVDIIPYRTIAGNHSPLTELLNAYGSFVVRRRLSFGRPAQAKPGYDPQVTGLLTYNKLVLQHGGTTGEETVTALAKARVLSLLQTKGPQTVLALVSDLAPRVGAPINNDEAREAAAKVVLSSTGALQQEGLLAKVDARLALTPKGFEFLADQVAASTLLSQQFDAAVSARAGALAATPDAVSRVATAAQAFVRDCIARRALGVAMAWHSPTADFKSVHVVALLQNLPEFMPQLQDPSEAVALVKLVQGLLSAPDVIEQKYIGVSLQAQFGIHLLGYDPDTLAARADAVRSTLFLVDASTVIPALGRSGPGHLAATELIRELVGQGACIVTTPLFVTEVAEHARFVLGVLAVDAGGLTAPLLSVALGRAGSRSNVFVEGFLAEVQAGTMNPDFSDYLKSITGSVDATSGREEAFTTATGSIGVRVVEFAQWGGFQDELYAERDSIQERIRRKRQERNTFRHDRQVKAEAEAVLIVQGARDGVLDLDGRNFGDSYFISNTRVVDTVAGAARPITMKPAAVLQWLSTLRAASSAELTSLTSGLLWELSERGLSIIDPRRIGAVFSPLVAASRDQLRSELELHKGQIATLYGEDHARAFSAVDDLDVPITLGALNAQLLERLHKELEQAKTARAAAVSAGVVSTRDREELEKFREEARQRRQRNASKKRAVASKGKRKKPKKK